MAIQEEEDHTGSSVEDSVHEVYQETGGPASKEDVSNVANVKENVFVDKVSDVEVDKTLEKALEEEAKVEAKAQDVVATRGSSEVTDSKTEEVSSEPVEAVETSRDVPATEELSKLIEASDGGAPLSEVSHEAQVDELTDGEDVPVTSADEKTSEPLHVEINVEPVKEDSDVAEQTPADKEAEDVSKETSATDEEVTLKEEGGEPKAVAESSPETVESSGEVEPIAEERSDAGDMNVDVEGDEPKSVSATEESSREVPESDTATTEGKAEEFKDEVGEAKGDEAIVLETEEKDAEPDTSTKEQDVDVDEKGGEVIESTVEILPEKEGSSGEEAAVEEPKAEPSEEEVEEVKGDEVIESTVTVPETESSTAAAKSKVEEDSKPSEPDVDEVKGDEAVESSVVTPPEAEEESSKEVAALEDSNVEEAVAESSSETVESSGEVDPITEEGTDAASRDINVDVEESDLATDKSSREPVAVEESDTATAEGKVEAEELKDEAGEAKGDEAIVPEKKETSVENADASTKDILGRVDDFQASDQDVDVDEKDGEGTDESTVEILPGTEEPAAAEEPQLEQSEQDVDEVKGDEVIGSTVVTAPEAEEESPAAVEDLMDLKPSEQDVDEVKGDEAVEANIESVPEAEEGSSNEPAAVEEPIVDDAKGDQPVEASVESLPEAGESLEEDKVVAAEEPETATREVELVEEPAPGDKPVETSVESVQKELDTVEEPVEDKVDDSKDETGEVKNVEASLEDVPEVKEGSKADSESPAALEESEDQVEGSREVDEPVETESAVGTGESLDESVAVEQVEEPVKDEEPVESTIESIPEAVLDEPVTQVEDVEQVEELVEAVPETERSSAEPPESNAEETEDDVGNEQDSKEPVEELKVEAKDEESVEASEDSIPETVDSSKDDVDVATEREVEDPVAEPDVHVDELADVEESSSATVKDDTTVQVTASDGVAEEALEKEASVEPVEHEQVEEESLKPSEQTVEESLTTSERSVDVEVQAVPGEPLESSVDVVPDTIKPDVDVVLEAIKPGEPVETIVDDTVKPSEEETTVDVVPDTVNPNEQVDTSDDVVPDTVISSELEPVETIVDGSVKPIEEETTVDVIPDTVKPAELVDTSVEAVLDTVKPSEQVEPVVPGTVKSGEPVETIADVVLDTVKPDEPVKPSVDDTFKPSEPVETGVDVVIDAVEPSEPVVETSVDVAPDTVKPRETSVDVVLDTVKPDEPVKPSVDDTVKPSEPVETGVDVVMDAVEPSEPVVENSVDVAPDTVKPRETSVDVVLNTVKPVEAEEVLVEEPASEDTVEPEPEMSVEADEKQVESRVPAKDIVLEDQVTPNEEAAPGVPLEVETDAVERSVEVDVDSAIEVEAKTLSASAQDASDVERHTDGDVVEEEARDVTVEGATEKVVNEPSTTAELGNDVAAEDDHAEVDSTVVEDGEAVQDEVAPEQQAETPVADATVEKDTGRATAGDEQVEVVDEVAKDEEEGATLPEQTETEAVEQVDVPTTIPAAPLEDEASPPPDELEAEKETKADKALVGDEPAEAEEEAVTPDKTQTETGADQVEETDRSLEIPEVPALEAHDNVETAEAKEASPTQHADVEMIQASSDGVDVQQGEIKEEASLEEPETVTEEVTIPPPVDETVDEPVDVVPTNTAAPEVEAPTTSVAPVEEVTPEETQPETGVLQVEETDRSLEVPQVLSPEAHVNVEAPATEPSEHADVQQSEFKAEEASVEEPETVAEESRAADELVEETVEPKVTDSTPLESIEVSSAPADAQDKAETIEEASVIQHADVESVQPSVSEDNEANEEEPKKVDEPVDVTQTGTQVDLPAPSDELEPDKETKSESEQVEAGQVEETDRSLEVQPVEAHVNVEAAGTESSQHADVETVQSTEPQVEASLEEPETVFEEAAGPSPAVDQLVGETVEEARDSTPVESTEDLSTPAPIAEVQDEAEPEETSPIQHANVESVQPSVGAGVEDGEVKNEGVLEETEKAEDVQDTTPAAKEAEDDHSESAEAQQVAEDVETNQPAEDVEQVVEGGESLPRSIDTELVTDGDQHVEAAEAPAFEDRDAEETAKVLADETLAAPTDVLAVQGSESLPNPSSASKEVQIPETGKDEDTVADAEAFQSVPNLQSQKDDAAEPAGEEGGEVKDNVTTPDEDQQGGEELVVESVEAVTPIQDSVEVESVAETRLTTEVENVDKTAEVENVDGTSLTKEAREVEGTTVQKDTASNEPSFEAATDESSRSLEPSLDDSDIVKVAEPTPVEATSKAEVVGANKVEAALGKQKTEVKPEEVVSKTSIEQGEKDVQLDAEASLEETKEQVFPVEAEAKDGGAGGELMNIEITGKNDVKKNENVVEELVQGREPVLPVETEVTEKEEVKNKESEDDDEQDEDEAEEASSKPGNIITSTLKGIVAAAVSLTRGTGAKPSKKKRLRLKKEIAAMQVAS